VPVFPAGKAMAKLSFDFHHPPVPFAVASSHSAPEPMIHPGIRGAGCIWSSSMTYRRILLGAGPAVPDPPPESYERLARLRPRPPSPSTVARRLAREPGAHRLRHRGRFLHRDLTPQSCDRACPPRRSFANNPDTHYRNRPRRHDPGSFATRAPLPGVPARWRRMSDASARRRVARGRERTCWPRRGAMLVGMPG